jgi:hypothetical protein
MYYANIRPNHGASGLQDMHGEPMNAAIDQQSLEPVARRTTRRIARRLYSLCIQLH